ncbi:MAG: L-glutamate gamma-semialdehyde dehydrogenase [Planctomycetota bacterium]|nr:L-glutamate gamma-semialdehyde dehydrogenase [Planctomycetota bacterium]
MSLSARVNVPEPRNEPILDYAPGSPERASLQVELDAYSAQPIEIPMIIGGKEVRSGETRDQVMPHRHGHVLAKVHQARMEDIEAAIQASQKAAPTWAALSLEDRAAIFLKAADLLAGPWRARGNASSMLNQSKTIYQAEIDAVCEIVDFWRFNAHFGQVIEAEQPKSSPGQWNYQEWRPLEGFIFAITPFNFASIQLNLPTAPALMGNVALWKPASSAVHVAWVLYQVLLEAGLPEGVINFIPGSGRVVGGPVLASEHLAGVHFTGSTGTFHHIWKTVGSNIDKYRCYPRLVGETGGKDFVFAHPSADPDALVTALVRGAYEYQGQKCSAASRAYIPKSVWERMGDQLVETVRSITMGEPTDFRNFCTAVIDGGAYSDIKEYIDLAHSDRGAIEILAGGGLDDSVGYFIEPTLLRSNDPNHRLMTEEIFGPVLTLYIYEDSQIEEALTSCDTASPYALTGSVFAQDRHAICDIRTRLRNTAGNFYINDKPTGAVVGQQPFGGARASGTNDKAGSMLNLLRWVNARAVKETFVPPTEYRYPFMGDE